MDTFLAWCDRLAERLKPHGRAILIAGVLTLWLTMLLMSAIQFVVWWLVTPTG